MSTDDERIGLVYLFLTPSKDSAQNFQWQIVCREGDDIQRSDRLTAHRIHIRERIRGCDLTEVEGIVDDRRKKIHCLHEREIVGQAIDPGVVESFAADKQPWI